ncbi:F-box/LRR-repeat protein 4 isoform X2 [Agrilus planipennis]|uniref:F-box/LRR-repeat protein 4 isoform X1 n=1 Tax=Agrilus planipennis TaxID=224129 RepID=A0A1W4XBL9_AGRPL|nr:F-box/LRR-repeat protein 4 isoform X1 [Agrilus planipennis]XP_025836274.1 F-box/LRR-repeat protein 4 isoform X2 [Agrilus planipennis]
MKETKSVSDDSAVAESVSSVLYKNMVYLEQFAESILGYTSKYNSNMSISYAPENLIGKPSKFPDYGDFPETYMLRSYGKWWHKSEATQAHYMPQDADPVIAEDYVSVKFEYPVFPDLIIIYETYNPGAVVRLWGRMTGNSWKLLWEGPPQLCTQTSRKFTVKIKKIPNTINEVRIELNQSLLKYHTSLDAILLAGYRPKSALQSSIITKDLLNSISPKKTLKEIPPSCNDICENTDYFSSLPYEVLVHIFHYLDLRSLCRCSQVNQRFFEASVDASLYRELSLKRYWHKVDRNTLSYLMARCKTLKKLDLSWCGNDNMISEEIFVEFLQKCGSYLTHLSLGNCDFVKMTSLEQIGKCQEITDLRLRNAQCCSWRYNALANLKKLTALDLYSSNIVDDLLIDILKSNPNLKHLIIDFCSDLERLDQVTKVASQYNKNLITWSSWKTQSLTSVGVTNLARCNLLKELDLGWCLLLSDPGDCLERIAHGCKDLRRLIISGWRGINDHLLLPVIRSCKNLTQLDLLGVKTISKDIVERILASLSKLELLEISFCDSINSEQVAVWRQQYPQVTIQRSCEYVVVDYWDL